MASTLPLSPVSLGIWHRAPINALRRAPELLPIAKPSEGAVLSSCVIFTITTPIRGIARWWQVSRCRWCHAAAHVSYSGSIFLYNMLAAYSDGITVMRQHRDTNKAPVQLFSILILPNHRKHSQRGREQMIITIEEKKLSNWICVSIGAAIGWRKVLAEHTVSRKLLAAHDRCEQ